MNPTIVAAIIVVGAGGSLALLIWRINHRSKDRKSTSDWTSEGETSFVSKTSGPTADKQQPPVDEPKSQAPDLSK